MPAAASWQTDAEWQITFLSCVLPAPTLSSLWTSSSLKLRMMPSLFFRTLIPTANPKHLGSCFNRKLILLAIKRFLSSLLLCHNRDTQVPQIHSQNVVCWSWRRVTPVGLLPVTEVKELWCTQASVALTESRPPRHQQSSGWTKLWVTEQLQAESQERLPLWRSCLGNQTDNRTVTSPLRWPGLAGAAPAGPLPPQLGCFWAAAAADSSPANPPVCVIALLPNIWWELVMGIH